MKSLKQSCKSILSRLYGAWCRQRQLSEEEEADCVGEIADLIDPAAIPALLGILCSGSSSVGDSAAGTIQRIVGGCAPSTLVGIDLAVREMSEWRLPPIKPSDVVRLSRGLIGTLGVLSCHHSGYVRQAAVLALAEAADGTELPFLLIRLNDWVRPVREAAQEAVQNRLSDRYIPHFIHWLPLVFGLQGKGRVDHTPVFVAVIRLLTTAEARAALRNAMLDGERAVRRLAFRLLIESPQDDLEQVLAEALKSADAVLRLSAARELRTRLGGEPLREKLEGLAQDRFMPVRREVLYAYAEKLPDVGSEVLRAALLDPHTSIRETARFYLSKAGWTDFTGFYVSHLADSSSDLVEAAVAGVGETGKAENGLLVVRFLSHPNRRVRRAAVRAVGHLDAEGFQDELVLALEDERPSIAKMARDVLIRRVHLLKSRTLSDAFERARLPHSRALVLSLMAALQWWDSATLLVSATACGDQEIRELALEYLRRWRANCGRLTVRPSDEQLRVLQEAVTRNRSRLDSKSLDDLDEHLRLAACARRNK